MDARIPIALFALLVAVSRGDAVERQNEVKPEDSLRIYAAHVIKTPPFKPPVTGFAIYLGHNAFLSAAHVVGRWPLFTRPRILVAGLDLPATVIKMGFADGIDLTLVTVDETRLPIAMRLRRTPICKEPAAPGEEAFGVIPDKVAPTHILSPLSVGPQYRREFGTLTASVVTASGSGIFWARKKCLLGIVSRAIPYLPTRSLAAETTDTDVGTAGYFVPATKILQFLPKEFRY